MRHDHVIFFRNPSTDPGQSIDARDPYESAVTSLGFGAHTQPVLGQEFVNEDDLVDTLARPDEWTAVVATSKRAGQAWMNAVMRRMAGETDTRWGQVPLYTPGIATTSTFSADGLPPSCSPSIVSASQETGCAENLGPFIVSDITSKGLRDQVTASPSKPLLVLTGDKNSPELTDCLRRNHIAYEELEVYRTCPLSGIGERIATMLQGILLGTDTEAEPAVTIWFAFFSPSSAEAVLQARQPSPSSAEREVHWYEEIARGLEERYGLRIRFRMAAIGKTTGNYLRRQGFEDVAQAEKPNAECLVKAIADG